MIKKIERIFQFEYETFIDFCHTLKIFNREILFVRILILFSTNFPQFRIIIFQNINWINKSNILLFQN